VSTGDESATIARNGNRLDFRAVAAHTLVEELREAVRSVRVSLIQSSAAKTARLTWSVWSRSVCSS
jgi:hypothetical protein